MARIKYWGLTVARDIDEGVLVSMRVDGKFAITKKGAEKKEVLHVFQPEDIFNAGEKTLEKNFKRYIADFTDEIITITPDIRFSVMQMEARYKK